jgi:L-cysteine desulfidase
MEEKRFIDLLNKELVKSLGCTEPIAITYAVAMARRQLGTSIIKKVTIKASRNLIKNAMSVSIPGTTLYEINLSSVLMAGALGIIKPDIEKNLEILNNIKKSDIENAKELISEGLINVELHDSKSKFYLEVIVESITSKARVVIENSHTNVVLIEVDGEIINETPMIIPNPSDNENMDFLEMDSILEFVYKVALDELEIIQNAIDITKKICEEGLNKSYGLNVGKNIESNMDNGFFSMDIISKAISLTAAGSDARMSGCTLPAISNSGSGNQGISATMPVVVVAEEMAIDREIKIRAVTLSNLVTIYIKSHLGRLSPMCGAIISSMGACCGITFILGGKKREIESALQIMMANVTGMICDGAKSGCALKVSTCTYAAFQSALLAVSGVSISEKEGIIEKNLEKTIENFCTLANTGMKEADRLILEMMMQKTHS